MTNRYENNTSDRSTTEGASERSATMAPEEPCNHLEVIRDDYPRWQYDYCPKCGEKL